MKKKNFLYTGALALNMLMSGCSDSFLDMNNYGAYDDFDSETKITWYLAGLYQNCFENYTSPTSQYLGLYTSYAQDFNEFTDETWGITSTSRIDPSTRYSTIDDIKTQTDASSGKSYDPLFASYFGKALGSSVTNNAYTRIRNCNILLRDIEPPPSRRRPKTEPKAGAFSACHAIVRFSPYVWLCAYRNHGVECRSYRRRVAESFRHPVRRTNCERFVRGGNPVARRMGNK